MGQGEEYKGMFDCLRKVASEEGPKALYKGLTPFVTHLTLKYALRFGLFETIRVMLNGGKTTASSNSQNFIAGKWYPWRLRSSNVLTTSLQGWLWGASRPL